MSVVDRPRLVIDGETVSAGCLRCRLKIGRESVCLNCGAVRARG